MSKAFTKDDDGAEPAPVPPRAPLPPGVPNYVTPGGLQALKDELAALEAERQRVESAERDAVARRRAGAALAARQSQLAERIATAAVVEPPSEPGAARFGSVVVVRDAEGVEKRYRIVGVDEADPVRGDVAFTSPIARALLGHEPGDEAVVSTPRGEVVLEVVAIE